MSSHETFLFHLVKCVEKCCVDHGLPMKCLEEKMEGETMSGHNSTHLVVTMVMSNECHDYQEVLQFCKSDCVDDKEGKLRHFHFYSLIFLFPVACACDDGSNTTSRKQRHVSSDQSAECLIILNSNAHIFWPKGAQKCAHQKFSKSAQMCTYFG